MIRYNGIDSTHCAKVDTPSLPAGLSSISSLLLCS